MYSRSDTSFFPKKLSLFTKLVYKQIGEALQSVKLLRSAAVKRFTAALTA